MSSTGSASQVSGYHTLLCRVERNPDRWSHLSMTAGREAIGNIIETGTGKGFMAFAFDRDDRAIGAFNSRKAARRAVYEAHQRQCGRAA